VTARSSRTAASCGSGATCSTPRSWTWPASGWRGSATLSSPAYGAVVGLSVLLVLVPGAPLMPILFLTQALNAILLLPLLILLARMSRDRDVMGTHRSSRAGAIAQAVTIGMLGLSVSALVLLMLLPA
jgi:Mn2+/Fe2+ NRAMP family transporter